MLKGHILELQKLMIRGKLILKNKDDILNDFLEKLVVSKGNLYIRDNDKYKLVATSDISNEVSKDVSPELEFKIQEHGKICDYLKELYATKNADYGDSMHPLFEEYGLTAFLILFSTKIQRIKNLKDKENDRNYESLEDSLLDLANYALIAVTELRAKNNKD